MTARDALAILDDLPRYEESLSARTGGLTLMLWAFANAGIFLTYTAASDWLDGLGAYWAFSVLWVPWVVGGSWASAALWRSHAITLRRTPEPKEGVRLSVAFTAIYLAAAAALYVGLETLAGVDWSMHATMAVASGLLALAVGTWQRRACGLGARYLAIAGLAMVAGAVALGLSPLDAVASGLATALLVGVGWFAAGAATYRTG